MGRDVGDLGGQCRMDPLEVFDIGDGRFVVDVRCGERASAAASRWTALGQPLHGSARATTRLSDSALSHRSVRDGFRDGLGRLQSG